MAEKKNVFALIVGIDTFKNSNIPPLGGCVNDAKYMLEYLREWSKEREYPIDAVELYNEQATRNAILLKLQEHFFKAKEGDIAFFFLASHGSTEAAHPYFEENGNLVNTIVCHDSRSQGADGKTVRDIMDKELRFLIRKIWEKTKAEIVIMQDTCHSGGATRFAGGSDQATGPVADAEKRTGQKARCYSVTESSTRSADDFLSAGENASADFQSLARGLQDTLRACFNETEAKQKPEASAAEKEKKVLSFNEASPEGNHIHFSGCMKHQYSYEGEQKGGKRGGNFTHALVSVLRENKGNVSYEELQVEVAQRVLEKNQEQQPMFTCIYPTPSVNKLRAKFLTTPPDSELDCKYMEEVNVSYKSYKDANTGQILGEGWFLFMGGADSLKVVRKGLDAPMPVEVIDPSSKKSYPAYIVGVLADKSLIEFAGEVPDKQRIYKARINETHRNLTVIRVLLDPSVETAVIRENLKQKINGILNGTLLWDARAGMSMGNAEPLADTYALELVENPADAAITLVDKGVKFEVKTATEGALTMDLGECLKRIRSVGEAIGQKTIKAHLTPLAISFPDLLQQKENEIYKHHFRFITDASQKPNYYIRMVSPIGAAPQYEVYFKIKDDQKNELDVVVVRCMSNRPEEVANIFPALKKIAMWETVRQFGNPHMLDELKFQKGNSQTPDAVRWQVGDLIYDTSKLAVQLLIHEFFDVKEMQKNKAAPNMSGDAENDEETPPAEEEREVVVTKKTSHEASLKGTSIELRKPLAAQGLNDTGALQAKLKFEVKNNTSRKLYLAGLVLDELYGVSVAVSGAKSTAEPGQSVHLYAGDLAKSFQLLPSFSHLPFITIFVKVLICPGETYNLQGFSQTPLPEPRGLSGITGVSATRAVQNDFGFNYGDWGAITFRITLKNPNYQPPTNA